MSIVSFNILKRAIIASLTPDLLEPKYRAQLTPDAAPETGHCAVASEAFYYLSGGAEAGFIPTVCGYAINNAGDKAFGAERDARISQGWRRETHWWITGPDHGVRGAGKIFDLTANQYKTPFPYERGRNSGFMQPQRKPSKRAQIVIDRVTQKLGAAALAAYRRASIAAFRTNTAPHRVSAPRLRA